MTNDFYDFGAIVEPTKKMVIISLVSLAEGVEGSLYALFAFLMVFLSLQFDIL